MLKLSQDLISQCFPFHPGKHFLQIPSAQYLRSHLKQKLVCSQKRPVLLLVHWHLKLVP